MKRKLFRKNLYSFSKQGLAENLLPVSKEFKKKLVNASLSSPFEADRETKNKLERNLSPYSLSTRSKRMQRGKARLFSQFFDKQKETSAFINDLRSFQNNAKRGNSYQSSKALSFASSKDPAFSFDACNSYGNSNLGTAINSVMPHKKNSFFAPQGKKKIGLDLGGSPSNGPKQKSIPIKNQLTVFSIPPLIKSNFEKNQDFVPFNQKDVSNLPSMETQSFSARAKADSRFLGNFCINKEQKIEQGTSRWNLLPFSIQKQNTSQFNLLLSAEQVKTEIQNPAFSRTKQKKEYTPFLNQIRESKKLRYLYGNLSATQLKKIALRSEQLPGTIADNLLLLLESRLDTVCQRCQFFPTIKAARQYITHKGVWINSILVTSPSYQLSPGDVIRLFDPKKLENPFLSLPLKSWKKTCKLLEKELNKNVLQDPNDSNSQIEALQHLSSNLQKPKRLTQQVKKNFIDFVKNEYGNILTPLDVSAWQLLASRFAEKNNLNWEESIDNNLDSLFFHTSEKTTNIANSDKNRNTERKPVLATASAFNKSQNKIDFGNNHFDRNRSTKSLTNTYKKWLLLNIFSAKITNNSKLLFNDSVASFRLRRDLDENGIFLNVLTFTRFLSTLVTHLPKQLYKFSNTNTSFPKASENKKSSPVKSSKIQFSKTFQETSENLDLCDRIEQKDITLFLEKKETLLKNNSIKKFFFDSVALRYLDIESLFFCKIQHEDLLLKTKTSKSLQSKGLKFDIAKHSISSVKNLFVWAQNLSFSLLKKIQKKSTQSFQSVFSNFNYLCASSEFSNYILCIFLLHMQKRFVKRSLKRVGNVIKQNSTSSNNEFSRSIEKLEKISTFYQKKSKPLHLEISYQSLSAIFLFPPQKVYLNAIIDLHTVVKALLR